MINITNFYCIFDDIRSLIENYNKERDFFYLKKQVQKIIELILVDGNVLSEISVSSYTHQLGFDKICLHTFSDNTMLRMHFWPKYCETKEDVHSHSSNFKSIILNGGLNNTSYTLTSGKTGQLYKYVLNHTKAETECLGWSDVVFENNVTYRVSDSYCQNLKTLHCVNEVLKDTISLSLWSERKNSALVFKSGKGGGFIHSGSFVEVDLVKKLINILDILKHVS